MGNALDVCKQAFVLYPQATEGHKRSGHNPLARVTNKSPLKDVTVLSKGVDRVVRNGEV